MKILKNNKKLLKNQSGTSQQQDNASSKGASLYPPSYGIHAADNSSGVFIQTKSKNESNQKDKYEREAEELTPLVLQRLSPSSPDNLSISNREESKKILSRKSEISSRVSSFSPPASDRKKLNSAQAENLQKSGGGNSLPDNILAVMGAAFGTDFSQVRIHTDSEAAHMNNKVNAKAFTYGSDIYFNHGMFAPDTLQGRELLAHELIHTLQQHSSQGVQRTSSDASSDQGGSILDDIINFFAEYADDIPGYTLFSVIIEYDIIRGRKKERTPINFLHGVMALVPGGNRLFLALQENGVIQKAFEWLEEAIEDLNISFQRIKNILSSAYDRAGFFDFLTGEIISILIEEFTPLFNDLVSFGGAVLQTIFTFLKEALLVPLANLAKETKGYELLTKVLGRDIITGETVEATTEDILTDFLILIGKEQELEQMQERGTVKKTADWLDTQIETFFTLWGELKGAFSNIWNNFELADWLQDPLGKLEEVVNTLEAPVTNFLSFAWEVAKKVLQFIKDALLKWLGTYLKENLRGFKLLTVILGKDPITDESVERTGENLILGFLSLILSDERIQEIEQTGAIQNTLDWIQAKVDGLGLTWDGIVQLFTDLWKSFSIDDLIHPLDAFDKIMEKLAEPVVKIFNFIKEVVVKVVQVILEIMNFPVDVVVSIIEKAKQAFEDIKRDPIQFFLNLLSAIKLGFQQFFDNILTHLLDGVKAWLFKQLEKLGISPPEDFSLQSILALIMEILGISTEKIFEKIEKKIGKEKMDRLRSLGDKVAGVWNFVTDIIQGGPAAIWEKIKEKLGNLWDLTIGFIKDWIIEKIIDQVTVRLLSMLDPTGIMAVVNSVMALYDTIRSAIEYFVEMLEIVNSFVSGVAEVARGVLNTAADYLEGALRDGIPVAIGFLANILHFDELASRLEEILTNVRMKVDEGIDWLIDKAIALGSSLLEMGKAALQKVKDWWKVEEEFIAQNGEKHTLYFKGSGTGAQLMIASNKQPFSTFIELVDVENDTDKKKPKGEALKIAIKIDEEKNKRIESGLTPEAKEKAEDEKDLVIATLLKELAKWTKKLFGEKLPDWKEPEYGDVENHIGSSMHITILTISGMPNGSSPTQDPNKTYDVLNKRRQKSGASYYVRGHLLNKKLGGPGTWDNMTPLSRKGNSRHEKQMESLIKDAVELGAIVEYLVTPFYEDRSNAKTLKSDLEKIHGPDSENTEALHAIVDMENLVPKALNCEAYLLESQAKGEPNRKQVIKVKDIENPVERKADSYYLDATAIKFKKVKINAGNKSDILRIKEIDSYMTEEIAYNIAGLVLLEGPFYRYKTLANAIKDAYPSFDKEKITTTWRDYITLKT